MTISFPMHWLTTLILIAVTIRFTKCAPTPDTGCKARSFGYDSIVCVCTGSQCDKINRIRQPKTGSFVQITSAINGLRFAQTQGTFRKGNETQSGPRITVQRGTRFQEIIGFGGAFTDSATMNIMTLPHDAQEQLLRAYFSEDGLEYNMGRVPIGGSDFSTHTYTYHDVPGDVNLTHFQLHEEDLDLKIPVIKRAKAMMPGPDELFLTSAVWSAPTWMKTNNAFTGIGLLKNEYFQVFADYHIRFLDEYADRGIEFWALSTGNEPFNGLTPFVPFNSLGWPASLQSSWIRENLGPTLRASRHSQTKLLALDDQRVFLYYWLDWILENNETSSYIDGIALHWYVDFATPTSSLITTHNKYPNKFLLYTESCVGSTPWENPKVQLGSWSRAELLVEDIFDVLNNWVTGWIDWNLALDPKGGPNWASNFVDAPIIVNSTSGEFYKQPMFYALGHFSKFVPRGSVRIASDLTTSSASVAQKNPTASARRGNNGSTVRSATWGGSPMPKVVAFQRPDKTVAVVILNKHSSEINIELFDDAQGKASLRLPARSIVTVVYS